MDENFALTSDFIHENLCEQQIGAEECCWQNRWWVLLAKIGAPRSLDQASCLHRLKVAIYSHSSHPVDKPVFEAIHCYQFELARGTRREREKDSSKNLGCVRQIAGVKSHPVNPLMDFSTFVVNQRALIRYLEHSLISTARRKRSAWDDLC